MTMATMKMNDDDDEYDDDEEDDGDDEERDPNVVEPSSVAARIEDKSSSIRAQQAQQTFLSRHQFV